METTTRIAPEIRCQGCVDAITRVVSRVPGVHTVQVDLETKKVTVAHDTAIGADAITAALEKAGFPSLPA